jgi:hypothetical protein
MEARSNSGPSRLDFAHGGLLGPYRRQGCGTPATSSTKFCSKRHVIATSATTFVQNATSSAWTSRTAACWGPIVGGDEDHISGTLQSIMLSTDTYTLHRTACRLDSGFKWLIVTWLRMIGLAQFAGTGKCRRHRSGSTSATTSSTTWGWSCSGRVRQILLLATSQDALTQE